VYPNSEHIMATTKAAKKSKKGARGKAKTMAGKTAATGKTPAAPRSAKKAAAKKTPAKKGSTAAKRPRPRRPDITRDVPYVVSLGAASLTLKIAGGTPVSYDILLFVDESKLTPAQTLAIDVFLTACGLHEIEVAIGKAWGRP
jgi:hypothetical protein